MKMNKWRVLLADDEFLALKALKITIPWEELNCTVIGECFDGETAFQKVQQMKADIIITDINMPRLSGIDLIKKLHEAQSDAQIIIISGYDRFEYAQEALRYGVLDYLLKPLSDEKIVDAILCAQQQIQDRKQRENRYIIQNCIHKSGDMKRPDFENKEFRLLLFQCEAFRTDWKECSDILQHSLEASHVQCYSDYVKECLVVLTASNRNDSAVSSERMKQLLSRFMSRLSQRKYYVGIGKRCENFAEVRISFAKLSDRIELATLQGSSDCWIQEDPEKSTDRDIERRNVLLEQYKDALRALNDEEKVIETLEKIQSWMSKQVYLTLDDYKSDLVYWRIQFCEVVRQIYGDDTFHAFSNVLLDTGGRSSKISVEEFIKEIKMQTVIQMRKLRNMQKDTYSEIIKDALNYIEYHYTEELGLNELALKLGISASYLSTVFSREVGLGINVYISQKRMEKAKWLLKQTNLKIREIAESVGYHSDKHFIKVFEKYEKMTPSCFRLNEMGKNH